jgi:hypothetical protein
VSDTQADRTARDAGEGPGDGAAEVLAGPAAGSRRRRIDKQLVVVSLIVAIGLALVARGLAVGITGDDRANLPDQLEEVDPVPEAVQVLSQTRVFVDLEFGYTGVLVIDGTEIPTVNVDELAQQQNLQPGQQIDLPPETVYEPGNATLTFLPSDEALITEFGSGLHRAQVIFWKVDEGRQRPRSYSWTFNVV